MMWHSLISTKSKTNQWVTKAFQLFKNKVKLQVKLCPVWHTCMCTLSSNWTVWRREIPRRQMNWQWKRRRKWTGCWTGWSPMTGTVRITWMTWSLTRTRRGRRSPSLCMILLRMTCKSEDFIEVVMQSSLECKFASK